MKRIIPIIVVILITGISIIYLTNSSDTKIKKSNDKIKCTNLLDLDEYKDLKLENISYLEETRYIEAGDDTKKITDQEEITRMYNMVKNIKLSKETTMACEDNTTIYRFYLNDGKTISIIFECEILVTKNKRYLVKE